MSDSTNHAEESNATTEYLYREVQEGIDRTERRLLFALYRWHNKEDNYVRIAEAVGNTATDLRTEALRIQHDDGRNDSLRRIDRILSVVSFHNELTPYVDESRD